MKKNRRLRPVALRLEELEARLALTGNLETFDTTAPGTLPAGWSQWSSTATTPFAVSSAQALSAPNSLAVDSPATSGLNARSWVSTAQPANVQVEAAVTSTAPSRPRSWRGASAWTPLRPVTTPPR